MRRYGGFGLDRIAMERKEESLLGKDGAGGGGGKNTPFVDRSKVRILLCDNDVKSSKEVFELLCKCSYQVTSVRTPRQVIDALNAEGRDIDIILAEVDLPVAKGLKMLKYIMRDKELRRIPIIMMSSKDEVSVVVKCLKRGAADYLVKPLRTNELLNLWTHMWRRREMLGLAEKNILSYDFDLVASDPSDPNTSTTLFSDDTDDRRRSNIPEITISNIREDECNTVTFLEPPNKVSPGYNLVSPGYNLVSPGPSKRTGQISSFLKKSELKVGISSAFFTYVKSNVTVNNSQMIGCASEDDAKSVEHSHKEQNQLNADFQRQESRLSQGNDSRFSSGDNDIGIVNVEKPCTSQVPLKSPDERNSTEEQFSRVSFHQRNEAQVDVSSVQALTPFPYYMSGVANQVIIPSPAQLYQGNLHDLPKNTTSMLPQYNPFHQHPHLPGVSSFPFYPVHLCVQPGQMPTPHLWPSNGNLTSNEVIPTRLERREAALIKFRQKRKDRCFDKKIRYINRKKLAERRPRVRGQFVRQVNGIDVDLNGRPDSVDDFDEEEDADEEELTYRDSSLDGDTSGF